MSSFRGVARVFLMKPCSRTMVRPETMKNTLAIRLSVRLLRTSYSPGWFVIGAHNGGPHGQPNSTLMISRPISLRSFRDNPNSHSRTGSRPLANR